VARAWHTTGLLLGGAAAALGCGAVLAAGDGLTVPRTAVHMTAATRLLDERQHLLRFFPAFVSSLDLQRRVPVVVVEHLSPSPVAEGDENGGADRSRCAFTERHPAVPEAFAARLDSYRGSGYTRGHLAAAGNLRGGDQASVCRVIDCC
jgi:DNA/RNA endonuclease G (NUC1)